MSAQLSFDATMRLLDALEQARTRRALVREGQAEPLRAQARALCQAQGLTVDEATLDEAVSQFQSIYPDTRPGALADPVAQRSQTPWLRPASATEWRARQATLKTQEHRWQQQTRRAVGACVVLIVAGLGLTFVAPWWGLGLILATQLTTWAIFNPRSDWFQRPRAWRAELDKLEPLPLPVLRAVRWWGVPAVTEQARQWLASDVPLLIGDGAELDARTQVARNHLRTKIGHRLLHGLFAPRTLFTR